jgi:hypothetical protein
MVKGMLSLLERAQTNPAWRRTWRHRPQRGLHTTQSKPERGKFQRNGHQVLLDTGMSEIARFSMKYMDHHAPLFVLWMRYLHQKLCFVWAGIAQSVSDQAMGLTTEASGFYSQQGYEIVIFSTASRLALWPIQSPIQWVLEPYSPGIQRPGCEADLLLRSSAKVKNAWSYTSVFPYIITA